MSPNTCHLCVRTIHAPRGGARGDERDLLRTLFSVFAAFLVLLIAATLRADDHATGTGSPLDDARRLWQTGAYDEAAEAYGKLAAAKPIEAAIGKARCLRSVGKYEAADKLLIATVKEHAESGALHAELAALALQRGDEEQATAEVKAALPLLKHKIDQVSCRWIEAELALRSGRIGDAKKSYKALVDQYNDEAEIKDTGALLAIGQAAAQHARFNRLSDQFNFLVNDYYPDLTKLDRDCWQACYQAGQLFTEKYNEPEAAREYKAALAINPRSAETHAALAALALQNYNLADAKKHVDAALAINPKLLDAHLLAADLELAHFEPTRAIEILRRDALPLDPHSEQTLGRLAGAYAGIDGAPEKLDGTRLGKLIEEVNHRNPHAGRFYLALGEALEHLQRYPAAVRFYREAIERMPELITGRGQLGMVLMRLGEEVEGAKQLKQAFDDDPFNVRVMNTLNVLDVLATYATLETDHYIIRFDRAHDELLAKYAAKYLEEEVYPQLVKKFGYNPTGKTLIEIFNRAKHTDGHGWFSARMVGLPYLGTVGACAGRMLAMQSPSDGPHKFNWARVLRHEMVHVVNLQQTDFAIPHWFTEGLAVQNEGYDRPREWNALLARRLQKAKDDPAAVFNLKTIDLGFIRPGSSDDWTLAYCQAALYIDYMLERHGADSLPKMLAAYARHANTETAVREALGGDLTDFETGYRKFLEQTAASAAPEGKTRRPLAELKAAHDAKPDDLDVAAELAVAELEHEQVKEARELAEAVLAKQPRQQLAAYCLAELELKSGGERKAVELLEKSLDREAPIGEHLALLAMLKRKAGDNAAAADLYELGAKKFPGDLDWSRQLARVYLAANDDARLEPILIKLAEADPDDVPMRKKLAQLALRAKRPADAARWARQCLYIDVDDKQAHRMLAEALSADNNYAGAAEELAAALSLSSDDMDLQVQLAEAQLAAGQKDKARRTLDAALKQDPMNEAAQKLREKLTK